MMHDGLREFLESRMSFHMLLEYPLLIAIGWCYASILLRTKYGYRFHSTLAYIDWQGLFGMTFSLMVGVVWMIPAMLDFAIMQESFAIAKYFSLFAVGFLLNSSWFRMSDEMSSFLIGNVSWMGITAGILYFDYPIQLCVNYQQQDQILTGAGLIAYSVAIGLLLLYKIIFLNEEPDSVDVSDRPAPVNIA